MSNSAGKFSAIWPAVATALLLAAPAGAIEPPRLKPPAPGPQFVATNDLSRLKSVRDAISRRDYSAARALTAQMTDATAKSLGEWYYFESGDPLVSTEAADRFLDAHPEWPSVSKIQSHVEQRMPWTIAPSTVLAFYESRDPITGEGKLQLARAQFATGALDAGMLHLKDAWVNHSFALADEQRILANYGGRLTAEDHARRSDRLLWAREVATARRGFARLPAAERRRDSARASLLLGERDAERIYESLPAEDRSDPGVMLAAVRYFRRKEEEPRAIAIARDATLDPVAIRNAGAWWYEQNLLMRWAMKNRQYADAYAMAAHHALDAGSSEFAEAEFASGWIALRYLNDPERAEKHFGALLGGVSAPISIARGWYWLARAAEARGDTDAAFVRYSKAAAEVYTFYGQLAAEKVGGAAISRKFEEGPGATPEEKAKFGSRPAVAALRMLTDTRDDRAFLIFAYHIDDQLQSRGEFLELADLAMRMNAPHVVVRAGKVAVRAGAFAPEVAYPEISVPNAASRYAPAELILGLSRQESEFNPRAYSRAGARGVMQLIPTTAQATARKAGLSYNRAALLDDPHYNMTIGAAHLSHLIDRFGGSWIMTLAAYNAGVNRVDQWVEAYGDPRGAAIDPLDWMEQIPFEETRNYVQRVLENSQIYRSRLTHNAIAGSLARDIERAGPAGRVAAIAPAGGSGIVPNVQPRIAALSAQTLAAATAPVAEPEHVAGAPPAETVKEATIEKKPARTQARSGRRPSFSKKNTFEPKTDEHAAAPPVDATALKEPEAPPPAESKPLTMQPINSEIEKKVESEKAYAKDGLVNPASTPGLAAAPPPAGECLTYSDFIAETAKEEASAADLNAGALANLIGDGDGCETAGEPTPEDR